MQLHAQWGPDAQQSVQAMRARHLLQAPQAARDVSCQPGCKAGRLDWAAEQLTPSRGAGRRTIHLHVVV